MKRIFTRFNLIAGSVVLALLAFYFVQLPVRAMQPEAEALSVIRGSAINAAAQYSGAHVLYQDIFIPVGLARGQMLRYTWANLSDPDPQNRVVEWQRLVVRLLAADGRVIAKAEAPAVDAGNFQNFDFDRDQIDLPGEAGTGRLQFRLKVEAHYQKGQGASKYEDITLICGTGMTRCFVGTAEIIETLTGRTIVSFSGGMNGMILNDSSGKEHMNH